VHESDSAETALPFTGVGLTRRALDEALLARAGSLGVDVRRGAAVKEIATGGKVRLALSGGEVLEPATVFLATGKHEVRGAKRRAQGITTDLIGFKMYFRLTPPQLSALADHIEVLLFEGGYAGLQLVEDGMANLCLLAQRSLYERLGRSWTGLVDHLTQGSTHLAARLGGAVPLLPKPLTISQVPYGFVHAPTADDPPGLFRLGDQAGVIPSFSGDGMAIALHTGKLAAATYLTGGDAAAYHAQVRRDIGGQIRLASWLYALSRDQAGRRALVRTGQVWPGALRSAAAFTRIPRRAQQAAERLLLAAVDRSDPPQR
jgi:flavin-dependent dehydrogenase